MSIATLLATGKTSRADSLTWDSDANFINGITDGSGTWDTSTSNWYKGAADVPWVNANNDLAIFGNGQTGGAAAATVTLNTAITANGLIFNTSSSVSNYTITGNTLTLAGLAPGITVNAGVSPTINSVLAGTAGMTLNGSGTLTLGAVNTYTGGTTVSGGILRLTGTGAAGRIRGGLTINPGAVVTTMNADALGYTAGQQVDTVTINGGTFTNGVNGNNGFRTNFVLNGGSVAESVATTGTAGINFQASEGFGISSLASSTTSTISARLIIRAGDLAFNVAQGTTSSGIDLSVTAPIVPNAGAALVGLVKNGTGTMSLGAQNLYAGTTTVNAGTLVLTGAAGATGIIRGTATVNSGATLRLNTVDALGYTTKVSTLNVFGGTVNVNVVGNQTFTTMALTLAAGTISGTVGTVDLFGNGTTITTLPDANSSVISTPNLGLRQNDTVFNVLDGAAATDLLINSPITSGSNITQGNHNLIKNGDGLMLVTAANTYTGSTTINAGTLALGAAASLASPNIVVTPTGTGVLDVSALSAGNFAVAAGNTLTAGRATGTGTDIIGNILSAGTINIAGTGTVGTLTMPGNLALAGGSVAFDLSTVTTAGSGVNDLISVRNLDLSGSTNIVITKPTGSLATSGTYTLFTYSGALTGNAGNLALSGAAGGTTRQTFALDTASTVGKVLLSVAGSSANLTWVGDGVSNSWDINTTANWTGALDGNNKFFDGDAVTFKDSGSNTPPVNIATTVQPSSITVDNSTKDYTFTGAGSIGGQASLTKNGTGKLTMGTLNSFLGPVTVNAGTIVASSLANSGVSSSLGAGVLLTLGDSTHSATLQYTGPTTTTNRAVTIGDGGATIEVTDAAAILTRTGGITSTGTLTKTGPGGLTVTAPISGLTGLNVNGGAMTVNGIISGPGGVTVNSAALTLGAQNTFTGGTTVNAGGTLTLNVGGIVGTIGGVLTINGGNVISPAVDALGYGPLRVTTLNINGGTYTHTAANNLSVWGMAINMTGGLLQATNAAGRLDFGTDANAANLPTTLNTLASADTATLGGTRVNLRQATTTFTIAEGAAATDLLVSAPMTDGIVGANVTKAGPGLMAMTGASTYTGTTLVAEGTLELRDAASLASNITITPGALLKVNSLATGSYTLNAGRTLTAGRTTGFANDVVGTFNSSGTINVAGTNAAGTLTVNGDLTLSGGTVSFDLADNQTAGAGANDLIAISGNLTLTGSTTINISKLIGNITSGSYTLVTYGGALSGNASNLVIGGVPATTRQILALNTATPGKVALNVTGVTADLIWAGNGTSNVWDRVTANWKNASIADLFYDLDRVLFDDTGSNTPAIDIPGNVQPSSLTVNNSAKDYTFGGAAAITGATGLMKTGTGTLTINNTNSFTGPVAIKQGTVSVAALANSTVNSPLGAGTTIALGDTTTSGRLLFTAVATAAATNRPWVVNDGGGTIEVTDAGSTLTASGTVNTTGILTKAGAGALAVSGAISGAGSVKVSGGTLTLSVLNPYTGGTVVDGGTLALTFGGIAGAISGTLTINPNGTVLDQAKDALGYGPNRVTTLNLNGGTYSHTAANNVSIWGMAVNLTGGLFRATDPAGSLDFGTDNNSGNIPTTINTLASANTATIAGSRVNLRQTDTAFNVAQGAAATDLLVSAPIAGTGANLTKRGAGTMVLSAAGTYTGATNVVEGVLLVTGSLSGAVNVAQDATLGGTGSVGAVQVADGGIVSPGTGVGTLTTTDFSLSANSVLQLELGAPGVVGGTANDLLNATGTLTLDGTLQITKLAGFAYGTYQLFAYGGFLNDNGLALESGFLAAYPGSYVDGTTTPNAVNLVVVPEPGTLACLAGVAPLLACRRRRRHG